jgi:hypothetical protein
MCGETIDQRGFADHWSAPQEKRPDDGNIQQKVESLVEGQFDSGVQDRLPVQQYQADQHWVAWWFRLRRAEIQGFSGFRYVAFRLHSYVTGNTRKPWLPKQ